MRSILYLVFVLAACGSLPVKPTQESTEATLRRFDSALNTAQHAADVGSDGVLWACNPTPMDARCVKAKLLLDDAQQALGAARVEVDAFSKASDDFWPATKAVKRALDSVQKFVESTEGLPNGDSTR